MEKLTQLTSNKRLHKLDALLQLNNVDDSSKENLSMAPSWPAGTQTNVEYVELKSLIPFKNNPFKPYEGERLDDMISSIKRNGVLVPIIVRKIDSALEILSGHNRVTASKQAGNKTIPAILLENISNHDAMAYLVETNLIQRSFTDMSHSEKATVITLHHSKLFSQGKRNDILRQLELLKNPCETSVNATYEQVAHKLQSRDKIAIEYGLSKDTVARYLRVGKLITPLMTLLDNGHIAFIPAVKISFLTEHEQSQLAKCIESHGHTVDMRKADTLRTFSSKSRLDYDAIKRILSGSITGKPIRTPIVKVRKEIYARYFKPTQSAKEVQDTVEKALEMYFTSEQTEKGANSHESLCSHWNVPNPQ